LKGIGSLIFLGSLDFTGIIGGEGEELDLSTFFCAQEYMFEIYQE
jgi:hypothetical protein